jgi:hypothetical protein
MTRGIHIDDGDDVADILCNRLPEVRAQADQVAPAEAWDQSRFELEKALAKKR